MSLSRICIFKFLFVLILEKRSDQVDQNKWADASFPWLVDIFADKKNLGHEIESLQLFLIVLVKTSHKQ